MRKKPVTRPTDDMITMIASCVRKGGGARGNAPIISVSEPTHRAARKRTIGEQRVLFDPRGPIGRLSPR